MSRSIIVVDKEEQKRFLLRNKINVPVFTSREYLTLEECKKKKPMEVYNLSGSMEYQGLGYYVSLLAIARKQKVFPDLTVIQDLKLLVMQKYYSSELSEMVQRKLSTLKGDKFELSVYFGKNLAKAYENLCHQLVNLVKAPLFRVFFVKEDKWHIKAIKLLSFESLSETHRIFMVQAAGEYFSKRLSFHSKPKSYLYDIAILYNPEEHLQSSNPRAIEKFIRIGRKLKLRIDLLSKKDMRRVLEYDALFIRETTNVNHYTYRISRMAKAEGLVVIDDPDSILKCTNKVFLEEILETANINRPKSVILYKNNYKEVAGSLSYPSVIKQPDSSFSQGVFKAKTRESFIQTAEKLFKSSDLLLVQEYIPTDFDWRVGILNHQIIFVCKYFMAKNHWQILKNENGKLIEGNFETLDPDDIPQNIRETALKTVALIGDGLYGIDLKQVGNKVYLIEVNDNPNIDAGVEDKFTGDGLYETILQYFIKSLNEKHQITN